MLLQRGAVLRVLVSYQKNLSAVRLYSCEKRVHLNVLLHFYIVKYTFSTL